MKITTIHNITHDDLIKSFPRVFKKVQYIECGEGWYYLLHQLFSAVEHYIEHYIPQELQEGIYLAQCKEKFGTLRVYMEQSIPFIDGAIALAELMSGKICEDCGAIGQRRSGGWIRTLCNNCFDIRNKERV